MATCKGIVQSVRTQNKLGEEKTSEVTRDTNRPVCLHFLTYVCGKANTQLSTLFHKCKKGSDTQQQKHFSV